MLIIISAEMIKEIKREDRMPFPSITGGGFGVAVRACGKKKFHNEPPPPTKETQNDRYQENEGRKEEWLNWG